MSSPAPLQHPTTRPAAACPLGAAGWLILVCAAAVVPAMASAAEEVIVDDVLHVRNGDSPEEGVRTLHLREMWRAGGDEEEMFFGVVAAALRDDTGNIYLLDRQLSEVKVFSPEGRFLRTLSREGDGPGEVRRPIDLLFMPDGSLGILQMFPGKIVQVALDGTPAGSLSPGGDDPTRGGFGSLSGAVCRDGELFLCGATMVPGDSGFRRTSYLARVAADGKELIRYLEATAERNPSSFRWIEQDEYFVDRGGWAVGPDGRVYLAPERDRYLIHVLSPDGRLERVIERRFSPRKRTQEDKDRVDRGMRMNINGRDIEKVIADTDPCVGGLRVDQDGMLWVQHARSDRDRPAGIFRTWDLFDPAGRFVRQVAVACPGDPLEDHLVMLEGGLAVMITGYRTAATTMIGTGGDAGGGAQEEAAPLQVICYGHSP